MTNNSLNVPYVILSGTVLIGVIVAITVYQPMVSEAIDLRSKIEADTVTLNDKQAELDNIQSKVTELNRQKAHEDRMNVILPKEDSIDDVLRIIHVAAQESGGSVNSIQDQSFSIQSVVSSQRVRGEATGFPDTVIPLAVNVGFTGTYRELRVFLEKIEQSPRMMDVVDLTINKANEGEDIASTMIIHFYKYNLEETNI